MIEEKVQSGLTFPMSRSSQTKTLVKDLLATVFADAPAMRPVRIQLPIPKVDALTWLRAQSNPIKTYWRDREGIFEMAGIGAADTCEIIPQPGTNTVGDLFEHLRVNLSCAHPTLRYYGGMPFCASQPVAPEWRAFGHGRFLVPRFEIYNRNGRSSFVCNARCNNALDPQDEMDEIAADLDAITFAAPAPEARFPVLLRREDVPDREAWDTSIAAALDSIARGTTEKIVLARKCTLEFETPLDSLAVLHHLKKKALHCYLFSFQPANNCVFLGASPERLYKSVGAYVQSEALAATRPRGDSRASDQVFARELMHDDKELREHRYVIDGIQQTFARACRETRSDKKTSLVKLRDCQHLLFHLEGLLRNNTTDADLLDTLHPTPAIAGYPTREAVEWIVRNEPFARGWYAGPVGWVGYDSSEFAIGIRSARIDANKLTLYSGAGIVAGSTASQEWAEIEMKLAPFLTAFT